MRRDPIRGQTIRWTFDDGPMAGKAFEHTFGEGGVVTWRSLDQHENGAKNGTPAETKYELATVGEYVYAVSYLASSGYTLTVVLDYRTGRLVAFASNEKQLAVQHGSFQTADDEARESRRPSSRTPNGGAPRGGQGLKSEG
jgi:molybdenum cofactor biosynthesis protein MoaF